MNRVSIVITILLLILVLSSCVNNTPPESNIPQPPILTIAPAATTTIESPPTPLPTPAPTATPAPLRVSFAPGAPGAVRERALQTIQQHPADFAPGAAGQAEVELRAAPAGAVAPENRAAVWVYALVAPFPTLTDNVPYAELQNAWQGRPGITLTLPLRMSEDTRAAFAAAWGEPAPGAVEVVEPAALTDALWNNRPNGWGIAPFEQLNLRLKVLTIDGRTPLHRDLDVNAYPLALAVGLSGEPQHLDRWRAAQPTPFTNRDETKMTILAMTGVTALTRTTAVKMEQKGVTYPAEKIRDWLTSADVVHISNEVSFWEKCPPPEMYGMTFCSAPKYMRIITDVHTSVVELTGNHLNDYGWEPFSYTLSLYDKLGLPYYGGGRTITESQQAITLAHNGNLLGFVGCNPVGPPIGWVNGLNDKRPGAAPCDDAVMQAEIQGLRAAGALPIATLQYWEFYHFTATYQQVNDFRELIDWGAAIASGSQGHHPQGFDLYNGGFIHYGVGNLFFGDQVDPNTRKTFVDRYLIYENRLLSIELLTAQIEDYSQPRPMTAAERRVFLQAVFAASGW